MQCVGIIDMNGLDNFGVVDPTEDLMGVWSGETPKKLGHIMNMMDLRCRFNGHRHPVIFVAEIDPEMKPVIDSLPSVEAASFILRGASKLGFKRGSKDDWEILKKLVPEYEGTYSGEIYELKTMENLA